jgi:hypothetical protein
MDEHGDEHLTWEDEPPAIYNYELAEILADYKRDFKRDIEVDD